MSPYLAWYYVLSFFFCFLPFPSFVFSCVDVLRWFGAALVRLFFLFSIFFCFCRVCYVGSHFSHTFPTSTISVSHAQIVGEFFLFSV